MGGRSSVNIVLEMGMQYLERECVCVVSYGDMVTERGIGREE